MRVCVECGEDDDNGRITFVEGSCYRCSKISIAYGAVPVSPDGTSIREMRDRHKQWGEGNLGVDIVDADLGEMIDRAKS